ncbi:MAG TPA: TIGR01459 family HAD-type hydrolase [Roseobacter sp.]|uniref:Uncharacterized protein n=1 Tax=marine sediment metagenome TaxID=412755 RepID=A0A0F9N9C0_9ZZZZ|nr:TIGR01459 family HAD-type hydrolase [Roseobacter sp.]|tara:strand:+ start:4015 stop:4899 length:885 start_codon:yes stop_codon:yes gene_type:complete
MDHTSPLLHPSARIAPLSELIDGYDGLLCDIWGVLHNGDTAVSDAVNALCRARTSGRVVILITNAPRLSKDIYPQLARFGVPREAFDTIITSGDVTAQLIARQPDAPLFHFGPKRDQSVLEGLTNPIVDHPDAKLCLLTGPLDDTIETTDIYHDLLEQMHENAVEMICANPDLVVRSGNRMVICAGTIAQRYAQLGGKVSFAGKPESAIYDEALRRAAALTDRDIPKSRLLAIGDGLATDIKGAADNGFDAYFVAGGIHASEFDELNAQKAVNRIKTKFLGLNLVGVSDRLSWS